MEDGLPKGPGGAPTLTGCAVPLTSARTGFKGILDRALRWCLRPVLADVNDRLFRLARDRSAEIDALKARITALERLGAAARLARLERNSLESPPSFGPAPSSSSQPGALPSSLVAVAQEALEVAASGAPLQKGVDLLSFAESFRGSEENVRERHAMLLEGAGAIEGPLLDLGCGRGELLELCRERGLSACGVEADRDLVTLVRGKGLEVEQANLRDFLAGAQANRYGAVVLCHVLEHLPLAELPGILEAVARVLRPEGTIMIQSPNPSCLYSLARFWLDPTHVKPISAETISFFLEKAGFGELVLHWMAPVPEEARLIPIPQKVGGGPARFDFVEALNYNIEILNREFLGFQEWAVVARKLT